MNKREQELEILKQRCDLLIQTVHEMNEMIHALRDENQHLTKVIEGLKNE